MQSFLPSLRRFRSLLVLLQCQRFPFHLSPTLQDQPILESSRAHQWRGSGWTGQKTSTIHMRCCSTSTSCCTLLPGVCGCRTQRRLRRNSKPAERMAAYLSTAKRNVLSIVMQPFLYRSGHSRGNWSRARYRLQAPIIFMCLLRVVLPSVSIEGLKLTLSAVFFVAQGTRVRSGRSNITLT